MGMYSYGFSKQKETFIIFLDSLRTYHRQSLRCLKKERVIIHHALVHVLASAKASVSLDALIEERHRLIKSPPMRKINQISLHIPSLLSGNEKMSNIEH